MSEGLEESGPTLSANFSVPSDFHDIVLKIAHDSYEYLGINLWPCLTLFLLALLKQDFSEYVQSCHIFHLTGKPSQSITRAPLSHIQVLCQPFKYLIIVCWTIASL